MKVHNKCYEDRINEIHHKYINIISPFIMQLEVLDGEYPVEIINEIRAVFGHLSKCHLSDDDSKIDRNLSKADGHIKRAILDCYKYLCLAYEDKYGQFDKNYKNVDLSEVDNGEFLPLLCMSRKTALGKLFEAKQLELSTSDEGVLYNGFEDAYNAYAYVYNLIDDSYEKIERVKLKAKIRYLKAKIGFWAGIAIGIAGLIIALVK